MKPRHSGAGGGEWASRLHFVVENEEDLPLIRDLKKVGLDVSWGTLFEPEGHWIIFFRTLGQYEGFRASLPEGASPPGSVLITDNPSLQELVSAISSGLIHYISPSTLKEHFLIWLSGLEGREMEGVEEVPAGKVIPLITSSSGEGEGEVGGGPGGFGLLPAFARLLESEGGIYFPPHRPAPDYLDSFYASIEGMANDGASIPPLHSMLPFIVFNQRETLISYPPFSPGRGGESPLPPGFSPDWGNLLHIPVKRGLYGSIFFFRGEGNPLFTAQELSLLPIFSASLYRNLVSFAIHGRILRAKREWEATVDTIYDPMAILDRDLRVVRCNLSFANLNESTVKDLILKDCLYNIEEESRRVLTNLVEKAFMAGSITRGEGKLALRGEEREYEVFCYPLKDSMGPPLSVILYLRDVTESRRLQDLLVRTEKMASLGILASGVAHEINNPLSFIMGNLKLLREDSGLFMELIKRYESLGDLLRQKRYTEALEQIEEAKRFRDESDFEFVMDNFMKLVGESLDGAERIRRIVRDIGFFSHSRDEEVLVDINRVVESALNITASHLKKKAEVIREFEEVPPIKGHPGRLSQVFMNLLVNAADAIQKWGTIRISTSFSRGWVVVKVQDSGKGIPEKDLARIFDPFYTTKPFGEGTGLGLYISYTIVENHGGRISPHSEEGKGTTFTVRFPIPGEGPARGGEE